MTEQAKIIYNATKTAQVFHADSSFFRLNFGPVRCGKSVSSIQEVFVRAMQQEPASNGIRYSRWAIIRNTYPQLKSTTIKTWLHWFPEKYFGKIKWDSPISHQIKFRDIDLEIMFLALEGENDVGKMKSLELTGVYINELQYLSRPILNVCLERVNSFPHKNSGAAVTFGGVIADTNPPSTRHWLYHLEQKMPENYKVFHYDGAVQKVDKPIPGIRHAVSLDGTMYINNPEADYLVNIPDNYYYLNLIPGLNDEEIKVACLGQYGFTRAGKPVYPDYNDLIHYRADSIRYNNKETLYMGWDFGLTPAVVFLQWQEDGRLAAIKEITSWDFGIEKFAENVVLPFLKVNFPGWDNNYVSIGDPAGTQRNQVNMSSCIGALTSLGITTRPASSNDPEKRIGSVGWLLRKMHNGKGALVIGKDCPQLREGFMGDYQYEKVTVGGIEESMKPQPLKNFSSHVHDAFQYPAMHIRDIIGAPDMQAELSGSHIY